MKRKSALLFAVLLLLSLARAPAAHAASGQPSRERDDSEINIDKDAVPLTESPASEIVVEATADGNGAVSARPTAEQILAAVESVVHGESVNVRIAVTGMAEDADTISAAMPRGALEAVAETAGLEIVTDIGQMALSSEAIAAILESAVGEDVTLCMAREPAEFGRELLEEVLGGEMDVSEESVRNGSVTEVVILSGDQRIDGWSGGSVALKLPVGTGRFEQDKGYRVIQISADKSRTEHTGRCVTEAENLCVEISITHLSTFVVLAEPVEEALPVEDAATEMPPPSVRSSNRSMDMACITAGLAIAAGAAAVILLRPSRKA